MLTRENKERVVHHIKTAGVDDMQTQLKKKCEETYGPLTSRKRSNQWKWLFRGAVGENNTFDFILSDGDMLSVTYEELDEIMILCGQRPEPLLINTYATMWCSFNAVSTSTCC
tara:strand:- start:2195 stop:2533 length:339 start_codon:yes stop_codon:yes gene_type:complete